ncbi:Transcriptional regulator, GntR family domain / Aspartate aminotransferase [hydrothermal vent metagenome]|uniref:Transcriptional regulator, GntR family domain / Aspartate aminotransferase n=1 Tax=hydrothermal vent metagenome TaxID=652676 RepID=A0A3B0RST5_9ZZZZ
MSTSTKTIASAITELTPDGIARGIGSLVSSNTLPGGTRLPTVRELADALDVSPSTVGDAWQILRRHRIIDTEGRRGSFVRDTSSGPTIRYWQVPTTGDGITIDLGSGVPDARLLPNPLPIMRDLDESPVVASYLEPPVLEELEAILRNRWPFDPQRITILDGAMDAVDRLIQATVTVGDRVGISDPGFPPLFDMLDLAGAVTIPLPLDDAGLVPYAVEHAVDEGMSLLIVQPRAHNPTGISMTSGRRDDLAVILAGRPVLIIEDDHSGAVSGTDLNSLGTEIPDQVVHVRSFSKSHGPDFRLAAVGGCSSPISLVEHRRMLGPSWTSRLLQSILARMLTSAEIEAAVTTTAGIYATRRAAVVDRLTLYGIEVAGAHGLNIWLPVNSEATAVPMLAAHGIGVARGRPFRLEATEQDHIRVTTSALDTEVDNVTARLAEASVGRLNDSPIQNGGRR